MNQDVLNMIKEGKITYRYAYDLESAVYFGVVVVVIAFVYAIAQAVTRKFIG